MLELNTKIKDVSLNSFLSLAKTQQLNHLAPCQMNSERNAGSQQSFIRVRFGELTGTRDFIHHPMLLGADTEPINIKTLGFCDAVELSIVSECVKQYLVVAQMDIDKPKHKFTDVKYPVFIL